MAATQRMTAAEYRELVSVQKSRKPKYGNRRQHVEGIFFDSGAEVTRYAELRLLEAAGEIQNLRPNPENPKKPVWYFKHPVTGEYLVTRTPRYPNGRKIRFTPDFTYVERGKLVVEDVKGNSSVTNLSDSRLRIALMEWIHGITVKVVEMYPKSRRQAKGQGDRSVFPAT